MYSLYIKVLAACIFYALLSCKQSPKIIVEDIPSIEQTQLSPQKDQSISSGMGDFHQIQVIDILNTDKYTYINAKESDKNYWLATAKINAKEGDIFYFKGGLLKTNFYSQEFDRNFDTLYLVSQIINASQHPGASPSSQPLTNSSVEKMNSVEGSTPLTTIFSNPESYNNKEIVVSGQVVKVNNGIMGKNWIHVQDGTKSEDGSNFDLTITSQQTVPLGTKISAKGKIILDQDFGAGYRYPIIMDNAIFFQ